MQLKPWTEVTIPHSDVLKGTFLDAEFAADLSRVCEGRATPEYGDPVKFFERTFITEGMRLLMDGVVRRINGRGGDPVLQLQTAFGGGKTHTMLAVYHLVKGEAPRSELRGIPKILDDAGIAELPKAQIAVIDGNRYAPSQPLKREGITINCLWGEIAHQLGGETAYSMVAESDANGTSPGKEILIRLLEKYAPVVILMDEMVAYLRQFQEGKTFTGGTFDSNLSFIQALTEAITAVPKAALLASLPESNTETGSVMGKQSLAALEKYFGRVQALWKPVATVEAFEIVRRRLFNPISDTASMDAVCRAFADHYTEHADSFPIETFESDYLQRLKQAYPIHPEIFTRLYEDWSTLDGFQRTRGVLKLMAKVIYRLWKDGNRDYLITPGALPLYDANIKNESIYYLPQGWDPVVERDIDGDRAQTTTIDTKDPRLGSAQAARRVARTIFLGSAPSVQGQMVRGVEDKRILLGTSQPGTQPSVFVDALNRLTDRLHYLNAAGGRYWFDVRPNLRREMEERKRRFKKKDDVFPEIRDRLNKLLNKGCFGGIHIFTPSGDIPDDFELRLTVLSPGAPHAKREGAAVDLAEQILKSRGDQPRQHQNRIIFLAPDTDSLSRLTDQVRTYLAWKSILDDVENMKVNLDIMQINQVKKQMEISGGGLNRMASECYRWLLCPVQSVGPDGRPGKLDWECFPLNGNEKSMTAKIEAKLLSEEILISEWSPIHLESLLKQWFWQNDTVEINTLMLWQNMCDYLYMPRLVDAAVLQRAISSGVQSGDYFGYADGKDDSEYKGLKIGQAAQVVLDQSSLIVELIAAKTALEKKEPDTETDENEKAGETGKKKEGDADESGKFSEAGETEDKKKIRFYGTVLLDPHTGRMEFDQIYDEIISLLTSKPGSVVTLRLDIDASHKEGFEENIQRAVRENARTLEFDDAEFEEE
jgi:predicted AAA+ superfamily ATPase